MTISLYRATVPQFQQMLGAAAILLDKAEAFCIEQHLEPEEILGARLAEDMFPFAQQIKFLALYTSGVFANIHTGLYEIDRSPPPQSFAELKQALIGASAELDKIDPAELNGLEGRDVRFQGKYRVDFLVEDFLLSFVVPNFYFHATTAYDILRMKGLPISKADFMGRMPLKH